MRLPGWLPALATAALLFAPGTLVAQQAKPPLEIDGGGTELFRGLLDHFGIKPIKKDELGRLGQFDDVILISLGNANLRPERFGALHYLAQTRMVCSVLIASDTSLSLSPTAQWQSVIDGERITCRDPKAIHRDEIGCPYVIPIDNPGMEDLHHLFKGLRRVATNSPSHISGLRWGGDLRFGLARFPRDSERLGQPLPLNNYFAVGGEGPDRFSQHFYRLLVIADHSIFINQMLLEPGTDNLELTYRVIEYLQGPGKQRKRCIFYEDGVHKETFDDLRQAYAKQNAMPLPQVNLMAMQEKLTDLGNAIIDRLQTNNAHNNLLLGSSDRNRSLTIIARFFLILAAVAACIFLVRRLWRTRKPSDIPPPPAVASASTGPPGVFDRRQKELLRRDNLLEPVRDLVRDFFASIGIHAESGDRMPKVVIGDVVRKPDSLRAAIKDFWKIAYGPPQSLSIRRWRELEPFFERLQRAHAEGKWRFVVAQTTAGSLA